MRPSKSYVQNVSNRGFALTSWTAEQLDHRISEMASAPDGADVLRIMRHAGTEAAGTSAYATNYDVRATYLCRLCSLPLFTTGKQYDAETGWPSFTAPYSSEHVVAFDGAASVRMHSAYGQLPGVPVCCARCRSHLGHLFRDRGGSQHLARYCIDGTALVRVATGHGTLGVAYLAGGCFWHVQWVLSKLPGVVSTTVGYANGTVAHPSYSMVCDKAHHHYGFAETVEVQFVRPLTFEGLLAKYLETIDPFDGDGQGPNRGVPQYAPAIFCKSDVQTKTARAALMTVVPPSHQSIAVRVLPLHSFFRADDYHQMYIMKIALRATRDVSDPAERTAAEERVAQEFYEAGHNMEVYSERYRKFTQR